MQGSFLRLSRYFALMRNVKKRPAWKATSSLVSMEDPKHLPRPWQWILFMKKAIFAAALVAFFYGSIAKNASVAGQQALQSGIASTEAKIEAATK
jgi:hypothetical protein